MNLTDEDFLCPLARRYSPRMLVGYNDSPPCTHQVEEYLAKVVQLFSYLTDKDLFAEIYRNQLAKRLLNQRSASDDMERLMIGACLTIYI